MNLEEIAGALDTALDKVDAALPHLSDAATVSDECTQTLSAATRGSGDPDIGGAVRDLAGMDFAALENLVRRAAGAVRSYRDGLMGQPKEDQRSSGTSRRLGGGQREPAVVAAARSELPPPVVKNTGAKTHGRWSASGLGDDLQSIVSGRKDELYRETQAYLDEHGMAGYSIATHVETKLAVHMRKTGSTEVTVTINNAPCAGELSCDTLLPRVLPAGARLTVYGTTEDGHNTVQVYTGRVQQ